MNVETHIKCLICKRHQREYSLALVNLIMVVREGGFLLEKPLELTFALLKLVRELQTSFAVRSRGGTKKNPTTYVEGFLW